MQFKQTLMQRSNAKIHTRQKAQIETGENDIFLALLKQIVISG